MKLLVAVIGGSLLGALVPLVFFGTNTVANSLFTNEPQSRYGEIDALLKEIYICITDDEMDVDEVVLCIVPGMRGLNDLFYSEDLNRHESAIIRKSSVYLTPGTNFGVAEAGIRDLRLQLRDANYAPSQDYSREYYEVDD